MPFSIADRPDRGLCATCRYGHIREGESFAETTIACHEAPQSAERVTYLVRQCSAYKRKDEASRHEMEDIAWILEVKKGRVIGFRPPKGQRDGEVD